jgi:hypothetical protein
MFYTSRIRAPDRLARNQITPLTKLTRLPNVTVKVSNGKLSNKGASSLKNMQHCFISEVELLNWNVINRS